MAAHGEENWVESINISGGDLADTLGCRQMELMKNHVVVRHGGRCATVEVSNVWRTILVRLKKTMGKKRCSFLKPTSEAKLDGHGVEGRHLESRRKSSLHILKAFTSAEQGYCSKHRQQYRFF
mmetsp:Transcript_570/g.1084  ORF Transcript_570/g.1084 Transcript_570/m.1084 type:complete len:123 (-) Transcript_570:169-537(-)